MFTGIVEETGLIRGVHRTADGFELSISARKVMDDLKMDDSISVSGVCLTVVSRSELEFNVQLVQETLDRTSAQNWAVGQRVNLERAMLPTTRFGGHIVQGHVDATTELIAVSKADESAELSFKLANGISRYIVEKGSIALDGVSLTIAKKEKAKFTIAVIPHTMAVTTLGAKCVGDQVNVEVDIMAKYLENFLQETP